ncbi:MAG: twin-arginine translocase TatA/TatE family subunit [Nitrospirae bacterium]|nr:twin-arginine translocase TatA/TatE family subunit [Nitrospirota bacterium]
MFGLSMQELVIILIIILVLFGATRLPQIGSGIGQAIRNFKKSVREAEEIDVTPKKENTKEKKKEEIDKEESA